MHVGAKDVCWESATQGHDWLGSLLGTYCAMWINFAWTLETRTNGYRQLVGHFLQKGS